MIFLVNNLNKFATSFVKNQLSNDIEYIHQILQYSQNSNVANKNSLNISAGVEENIKSLAKKNSIRITVIDFSGVVLFDSIVDKITMETKVNFTDGKVNLRGNKVSREAPKKADYILYYNKNNPLAEDRLRYDVLFHTDMNRERGDSNGIDLQNLNFDFYLSAK